MAIAACGGGSPVSPRPPLPPFTEVDRPAEGAAGRGRLELPRPGAGRAGLHRRLGLAQPDEFLIGRDADLAFLAGKWARELDYRLRQGPVGLHRQPDRRAVPVRVPRRRRPVVPQLRQRTVGVRRTTDSCGGAKPASTTCRSPKPTGASSGRGRRPSAARPSRCASGLRGRPPRRAGQPGGAPAQRTVSRSSV